MSPAPSPAVASRHADVAVRGLTVAFPKSGTVIEGVDLEVAGGEFVCLLGPSGCGKSTLLNVIAGFVRPTAGSVHVGGDAVTAPHASRGMVFQNSDALFPWLTVRQNVEYGLRMSGTPADERRRSSDTHLAMVGLSAAAEKYPTELSGGMQQRVQIARVLANEPEIVLMDEPFGALDAQTREVMQRELDVIWRSTRLTVVFVTHDIDEAIRLADRVVLMTAGPAAGIHSVTSVEVPRPRDETDPRMVALHRELRAAIGSEVDQAMRQQGLTV